MFGEVVHSLYMTRVEIINNDHLTVVYAWFVFQKWEFLWVLSCVPTKNLINKVQSECRSPLVLLFRFCFQFSEVCVLVCSAFTLMATITNNGRKTFHFHTKKDTFCCKWLYERTQWHKTIQSFLFSYCGSKSVIKFGCVKYNRPFFVSGSPH